MGIGSAKNLEINKSSVKTIIGIQFQSLKDFTSQTTNWKPQLRTLLKINTLP
jgi:hypothetical protein